MSQADSGSRRLSKKRHLKDLSEDDVNKIVATSQQPGWLMKDIAQKYRITPSLVGKLCREATKQPDE